MKFSIFPTKETFKHPERANMDDVGLDVFAAESVIIFPGQSKLVSLGFKAEFSSGYECQVRSRSGRALKEKLIVLNAPGTIDPSYRGEYGVILYNADFENNYPIHINVGDKIAQLVFAKIETPVIGVVNQISQSNRGEGGFGSTGNK